MRGRFERKRSAVRHAGWVSWPPAAKPDIRRYPVCSGDGMVTKFVGLTRGALSGSTAMRRKKPWEALNGHEAGNGGDSQEKTYRFGPRNTVVGRRTQGRKPMARQRNEDRAVPEGGRKTVSTRGVKTSGEGSRSRSTNRQGNSPSASRQLKDRHRQMLVSSSERLVTRDGLRRTRCRSRSARTRGSCRREWVAQFGSFIIAPVQRICWHWNTARSRPGRCWG